MTVFLSTHVLPVVDALADRIGVLHGGRLVAEGTPTELKRRAAAGDARSLEDVFLAVTGGDEYGEPDRDDCGMLDRADDGEFDRDDSRTPDENDEDDPPEPA